MNTNIYSQLYSIKYRTHWCYLTGGRGRGGEPPVRGGRAAVCRAVERQAGRPRSPSSCYCGTARGVRVLICKHELWAGAWASSRELRHQQSPFSSPLLKTPESNHTFLSLCKTLMYKLIILLFFYLSTHCRENDKGCTSLTCECIYMFTVCNHMQDEFILTICWPDWSRA